VSPFGDTNTGRFPLPLRVGVLAMGITALLVGIWTGLWRLGWSVPVSSELPDSHGPLMISGFVGTLISLERAIALRKLWSFTGPALTGIGAVLLLSGFGESLGIISILAGSAVLSGFFFRMYVHEPELHFAVMGLGANLWFLGNLLWSRGFPLPQIALWWVGFLILTIVGERLELSRVLQLTNRIRAFLIGAVVVLIVSVISGLFVYDYGIRIFGISGILLAGWLWRYDLARRSVRRVGMTRFMALALMSGYLWLGAGGLLAVVVGGVTAGPYYDAILHVIFVGFIFSMIFGHAPVIFPAVLGIPVFYRPSFYTHLVLLHFSLILRIAGDLLLIAPLRRWGGLLNAVAVLVFLLNTVTSAIDAKVGKGEP